MNSHRRRLGEAEIGRRGGKKFLKTRVGNFRSKTGVRPRLNLLIQSIAFSLCLNPRLNLVPASPPPVRLPLPEAIIAAALIFLLGNSHTPAQNIAPQELSGDISITLKQGLWKSGEKAIAYQDITLDLACEQSRCNREVWGYAPQFNQADHQGTVEIIQTDRTQGPWRLRVKIKTSPDPWVQVVGEADYQIELKLQQNQLVGTYSGSFKERSVKGEISGVIRPHWPKKLPNHLPINSQEHPRLIFREQQLPALREKAKTPTGQVIIAQLRKSLTGKIYYDSYGPNGGYHAAGHCFLALLNEGQQPAETAWQIVVNSINQPGPRLLEQSSIVAGIALAYDLCYNAWDEGRRKKITTWLAQQTTSLIAGTKDPAWNPHPQSNWNARARGAAGLAALAILKEPDEFFSEPTNPELLLKIAERNIKRYMKVAIGEHGFGTEGDLYTRESLYAIVPFLHAYQNVLGKDLVSGSSGEWFLPHYVMRIVRRGDLVAAPTYGRHRISPDGVLFALGLGIVPERFLPGVQWFFNRYFGWQGDRTFGISEYGPHEAIFALVGYREDIAPINPAEIFGRVLVDEQKGFYSFRNQWQDDQDFVASIYLKREPLRKSWSFPDAGSFRIWGRGGKWADAGPSNRKQEDENVVLTDEKSAFMGAQPIFFQAEANGSGVVSLRRENWVRSLAVDYSSASGAPGLFVVVDKFTDGEALQEKTWVMHTQETVKIDGRRFTIQAASGATMQGTFVTPSNVKIAFEPREKGGVLRATGSGGFFVVMTVQNGAATKVEIEGNGLDSRVKVGGQTIEFRENRIILSER